MEQLRGKGVAVDRRLLNGDLCHDESWGGICGSPGDPAPLVGPIDLQAGNHDHPTLLRAVMGRRATVAPAAVALDPWRLLLLHSHRPGGLGGWLGHLRLLACPSTLRAFGPTQPCPLGQPLWPGGRLLQPGADGEIRQRLLRWPSQESN